MRLQELVQPINPDRVPAMMTETQSASGAPPELLDNFP